MPTSVERLKMILENATDLRELPETLEECAFRILNEIQKAKNRKVSLLAMELQSRVRMDPHRYYGIFKWLQDHEYCRIDKERIPRTGLEKHSVSITRIGEVALRKRGGVTELRYIASDLLKASKRSDEEDLLRKLFVTSFDLAFSELYYGGKPESYVRFRSKLEETIREHLDKEVGDKLGLTYQVSLDVSRRSRQELLDDAEEAMRKGHFLTLNHRYVLHRFRNLTEKALFDHNIRWRERIMRTNFTGRESSQDFQSLTDPYDIVEREATERNPALQQRRTRYPHDRYDPDKRWNPNIEELMTRWNNAREANPVRATIMTAAPPGLNADELNYWNKMDKLVDDLLFELRSGGMTRRKIDFDQTALKQLYTIVLRVDQRLATTDHVDKAFGKTSFAQTSKTLSGVGVGFTPDDVANIWIYALLGIFSTETEVMRQYLLQALPDKPPFRRDRFITLKPLVNGIVSCCPRFGAAFAKEIDVELRNALAHETYWVAEDTTVTPTKLKLRYIDELGDAEKDKPFGDVLFRARQQNLLTTIIAKQIQDKYDSSWFS